MANNEQLRLQPRSLEEHTSLRTYDDVKTVGLTPEQRYLIFSTLRLGRIPTGHLSEIGYEPNAPERIEVLGSYNYQDHRLTLHNRLERTGSLEGLLLNTIVHEQLGHGLTPFLADNADMFGPGEVGEERRQEAMAFTFEFAQQCALTGVFIDDETTGYHRSLFKRMELSGNDPQHISMSTFLNETYAILVAHRYSHPDVLKRVQNAQAQAFEASGQSDFVKIVSSEGETSVLDQSIMHVTKCRSVEELDDTAKFTRTVTSQPNPITKRLLMA